ncbi:uncharacterized protein LOC124167596 [Ischnura elegans]|uniref:uncharacterized protein LOC124167596 n=1 Tax=Ischnura elegans TaxID=197161 RepID=UPI001ED8B414|nr:uncharacterized protein LOC124167596 [Ischnura elegans]
MKKKLAKEIRPTPRVRQYGYGVLYINGGGICGYSRTHQQRVQPATQHSPHHQQAETPESPSRPNFEPRQVSEPSHPQLHRSAAKERQRQVEEVPASNPAEQEGSPESRGMKFIVVLLVVAVGAFLDRTAEAFPHCAPCPDGNCDLPQPEDCEYGMKMDACGRMVCARGPGQRCGGKFNILGICGDGTFCLCNRCKGCSLVTQECDLKANAAMCV